MVADGKGEGERDDVTMAWVETLDGVGNRGRRAGESLPLATGLRDEDVSSDEA